MGANFRLMGIVMLLATALAATACMPSRDIDFNMPPPLLKQSGQTTVDIPDTKVSQVVEEEGAEKSAAESSKVEDVPSLLPSMGVQRLFEGKDMGDGSGKSLSIEVEEMPLAEFIHLVYGKVLALDYYLAPQVAQMQDTVTLKMTKPMGAKEFKEHIVQILAGYGVEEELRSGVLYLKAGKKDVGSLAHFHTYIGSIPKNVPDEQRVILLAKTKYIDPMRYSFLLFRTALEPSEDDGFRVPDGIGYYLLRGKARNLRAAQRILQMVDRPVFADRLARLYQCEYITPKAFVEEMERILPAQGVPLSTPQHPNGLSMVSIESIDSVLVLTEDERGLEMVEYWHNRLDDLELFGDQPRYFIYQPSNRRAAELQGIFEGAVEKASEDDKESVPKSRGANILSSDVKIALDEDGNRLLVYASPAEYKMIQTVLNQLDAKPRQVLVEVTIGEVTLTDSLQFGLEWFLSHEAGDEVAGTLQTLDALGVGGSGLVGTLVADAANLEMIINAFASKNLVNILSTPRLLVLDNKSASINVGTSVPVVTSETTSASSTDGDSNLLQSIEYRDTGVILNVTPTIHSGGVLTLDISQEVSDAQTNNLSSNISSPLITTRNLQTTVVLNSGSSILLGGLIKENKDDTVNKVPMLGDLPVLGYLFKTDSDSIVRTELFMQITPYILGGDDDAETVTREFRKLLNTMNDAG